jgi:hypothetical protein
MSLVAGIAWKLDCKDLDQSSKFKVHWAWCRPTENGDCAIIQKPQTWLFTAPQVSGFLSDSFGASETRGLLGGIASPTLAMLSEQCERAIGDVLTYAVCKVLDSLDQKDVSLKIFIFGPALPKAVGRFCSLRLPDDISIAWISPLPLPSWISDRADELLLVPRRHTTTVISHPSCRSTFESWEEEALAVC